MYKFDSVTGLANYLAEKDIGTIVSFTFDTPEDVEIRGTAEDWWSVVVKTTMSKKNKVLTIHHHTDDITLSMSLSFMNEETFNRLTDAELIECQIVRWISSYYEDISGDTIVCIDTLNKDTDEVSIMEVSNVELGFFFIFSNAVTRLENEDVLTFTKDWDVDDQLPELFKESYKSWSEQNDMDYSEFIEDFLIFKETECSMKNS